MRTENLRKGPWFEEEDERLKTFVAVLGARRWDTVAKISGLRRSGKSCRLRWLNYLRPCLKHGAITPEEEQIILQLHDRWGNKWAKIARRLPGRTDNEVKNYWRTHLRKKVQIQNSLLHLSTSSPTCNASSVETSTSSDQTNSNCNQIDVSIQERGMITSEISSNSNNQISTDGNVEAISSHYDGNHKGLSDCMILNSSNENWLSDCIRNSPCENRLSDCITNSPCENRLQNWMNMLSGNQTDGYSPGCWELNNGSPELCLDYPMTWCLGDDSAWDFLDTIWNIDLFNLNE